MRFGLCTDIRNIKKVEELGFDYLEGKLNQFALYSEEDFQKALEEIKNSKIKVERCSLLLPKTMTVIGDKYDKKVLIAYLKTAFSRMQALGCSLVVFGSGKSRNFDSSMTYQEAFLELVEVTRTISDYAQDYNVEIAIESLNRSETNLINTMAESAALMAVVDKKNVGLLADAYHIRLEAENIEFLSTLGPLMHTHIALKENRAYPVCKCEEVEEFFTVLKKSGYDGTMSIEGSSSSWEEDSIKALQVLHYYDAQ